MDYILDSIDRMWFFYCKDCKATKQLSRGCNMNADGRASTDTSNDTQDEASVREDNASFQGGGTRPKNSNGTKDDEHQGGDEGAGRLKAGTGKEGDDGSAGSL